MKTWEMIKALEEGKKLKWRQDGYIYLDETHLIMRYDLKAKSSNQFYLMSVIDDWDRLILLVRGDAIHSIQFKVFDVNRPGTLDRIRQGVGEVLGSLMGRARNSLPDVAGVLSDSLGSAATDLESALITRVAGADRLLFRGSARIPEPGDYVVEGKGERGTYRIEFALRTV